MSIPTESEKAVLLERAIKELESADQFYLCTLSNNGIREFRSLQTTGSIGFTFLRVLSKLTEDIWETIDKATGRKEGDVKNE